MDPPSSKNVSGFRLSSQEMTPDNVSAMESGTQDGRNMTAPAPSDSKKSQPFQPIMPSGNDMNISILDPSLMKTPFVSSQRYSIQQSEVDQKALLMEITRKDRSKQKPSVFKLKPKIETDLFLPDANNSVIPVAPVTQKNVRKLEPLSLTKRPSKTKQNSPKHQMSPRPGMH